MFSTNTLDQIDLCRICLITERVDIQIFEVEGEEGEVPHLLTKINVCLPIKVSKDDKLPKKICVDCLCKLESFYQFYNISAQAEQQLLSWFIDKKPLESQSPTDDTRSKVIIEEFQEQSMTVEPINIKPDLPENLEQDDDNFFDDW